MKKILFLGLILPVIVLSQNLDKSNGKFRFDAPIDYDVADVVIIIGQSNANGRAENTSLPAILHGDQPAYVFTPHKYNVLNASDSNNNQYNDATTGFGLEMELSYRYNQVTSDSLYILKYAKGSRNLALTAGEDWNANHSGQMYDAIIRFIDSTNAIIERGGKTVNYLGVVWYQGESDALTEAYANAYGVNLCDLINGIRGHINQKKLPFIITRLSPSVPATYTYLSTVQAAMDSVSSVLSDVHMVDVNSDIYDYKVDNVHLDYNGQIQLGKRVANILMNNSLGFSVSDNKIENLTSDGMLINGGIVLQNDTTVTAVVGRIIYQAADSTFYGCRSTTANKKWYPLN